MNARGGRQLPLALRYPPDQRLETFVAAPEGVLAQLRALAQAGGAGDPAHGRPDWILLAGPAGVGKTHLALAVCAAADAAGRRAVYLPLKAAAGRLRTALDALEGSDVVALDGLDAIAGHRDDEVALFDFHNRARSTGLAVLYAAQASLDALPLGLPDLRSRLAQCSRILLSSLDDEGRLTVLRERAQRRGLAFDEAALDWLLKRVGRDLAGLTALFDQLDRASLVAQRRITVPFLRKALAAEE